MTDAFWATIVGTGFLVVVNVVTATFFYGKLCAKVEGNIWKIEKLWKKVFNSGG